MKKQEASHYFVPDYLAAEWQQGLRDATAAKPNVKGDADVGGAFGDDDPIDVVEIGASAQEMGAVVPVKPLGVLSMIDDGEVAPSLYTPCTPLAPPARPPRTL